MNATVLNEESVWQPHELLVHCPNGSPKVGQKVGELEILDTPVSLSNQNTYVLRLNKEHNLKRKDNVSIK